MLYDRCLCFFFLSVTDFEVPSLWFSHHSNCTLTNTTQTTHQTRPLKRSSCHLIDTNFRRLHFGFLTLLAPLLRLVTVNTRSITATGLQKQSTTFVKKSRLLSNIPNLRTLPSLLTYSLSFDGTYLLIAV